MNSCLRPSVVPALSQDRRLATPAGKEPYLATVNQMRIVKAGPVSAVLCFLAFTAATAWAQASDNSVGMKLVPLPGTGVLMAATEVTVDQFRASGVELPAAGFPQGGDHPVVNVSWEDAKKYCAWLSQKEGRVYRLPTDAEWSMAVGLGDEGGGAPAEKHERSAQAFPWGTQWPPPMGAGNFADESLSKADSEFVCIPGYSDGFAFTAPVGRFSANALGLHDLSGNVWEWCEDAWRPGDPERVLRGAAWNYGCQPHTLQSSHRHHLPAASRAYDVGFRVVFEAGLDDPDEPNTAPSSAAPQLDKALVEALDEAEAEAIAIQRLSNARQIWVAFMTASVDAITTGEKTYGFPADASLSTVDAVKTMLITNGYITEDQAERIGFDQFMIGNVSGKDPDKTILITEHYKTG